MSEEDIKKFVTVPKGQTNDCAGCEIDFPEEILIPICPDCFRKDIITKFMWDRLGQYKFKNPMQFATEYNDIVDDINKVLELYGLVEVDKFNLQTVKEVEQNVINLENMFEDLFII